jgi:molybdopterin/thiamine biosynthesis adenylyltransferase
LSLEPSAFSFELLSSLDLILDSMTQTNQRNQIDQTNQKNKKPIIDPSDENWTDRMICDTISQALRGQRWWRLQKKISSIP